MSKNFLADRCCKPAFAPKLLQSLKTTSIAETTSTTETTWTTEVLFLLSNQQHMKNSIQKLISVQENWLSRKPMEINKTTQDPRINYSYIRSAERLSMTQSKATSV